MKTCKTCKTEKDLSCFGKRKGYKDGLQTSCRECMADKYAKKKIPEPVEVSEKRCFTCKLVKSSDDFGRNKRHSDGLKSNCKECQKIYDAKWRENHFSKEEHAAAYEENRIKYQLKRLYNITVEKYESLLEEQNFACAVCKRPEVELKKRLNVDHDHDCCSGRTSCGECVRGLLCDACNRSLGMLKDSVEVLESAIQYLNAKKRATN